MEERHSRFEPVDAGDAESCARALGHRADALRSEGRLPAAGDLLAEARSVLDVHGGGSRRLRSELDGVEAALRWAQCRFGEAKALLVRAVISAAVEGENVAAARRLLSLALVYRETGELRRAVDLARELCSLIDRSEELADLRLHARHHLTRFLIEAGAAEESRRLLEETASLLGAVPGPVARIQRLWVEGHLARATGEPAKAEGRYSRARDGFVRERMGHDAALVYLDLATLYAEQRRLGDLQRLADEIVPLLVRQEIHSEPLTALLLFRDAARTGRVTLPYLQGLCRYLERARLQPGPPFQRPA